MSFLAGGDARRIVRLIITGDSAGAVKAITAVADASETSAARMKAQGAAMQTIGRTALGLTTPLIGLGVVSGRMAMNFQQAMEMIHTQAGASQQAVNKLSQEVLNLAGNVTQSPQQLAEGLFHLKSIGLDNVDAMKALKISAQGAMVGQADLEDTASALGSAWLVNIKGAGNFHHTMAVLNATVGAGNMRMNELVDALKSGILPAAKHAGLSLQDVMAALATLKDAGYPAYSAMAQLGTALHYLYNPSKAAQTALQNIGLSSGRLGQDMHKPHGLVTALKDLRSHLERLKGGLKGIPAEQTLGEILPGGRGRVMLSLMELLGRYEGKSKQIGDHTNRYAGDVAKASQTNANQIRMAWSSVDASLIRLGQTIMGPAAVALKLLAGVATAVFGAFSSLPAPVRYFISGLTLLVFTGGGVLLLFGKLWRAAGALKEAWGVLKGIKIFQNLLGAGGGAAAAGATEEASGALVRARGPTETMTAFNQRLAASYDELAFSAGAASKAVAGTTAAETGGAAGAGAGAAGTEARGAGLLGRLGIAGMTGVGGLGLVAGMYGLSKIINLGAVKPLTHHERHQSVKTLVQHGRLGALRQAQWSDPLGNLHHHAMGGPILGAPSGTDSEPAMLMPGEYVIREPAARAIGPAVLNQMNTSGRMPQQIRIEPGVTVVKINEREIAHAVTRYVQRVAARGPSGLVGGQLATNVTGPAYTQP